MAAMQTQAKAGNQHIRLCAGADERDGVTVRQACRREQVVASTRRSVGAYIVLVDWVKFKNVVEMCLYTSENCANHPCSMEFPRIVGFPPRLQPTPYEGVKALPLLPGDTPTDSAADGEE